MPIVEVDQQTPEWLLMRTGMATASRVKNIITKRADKKGYLQGRADYRTEIICELLTGRAAEHYVTPAMEWGIEQEPFAREKYAVLFDVEVLPGWFAIHDSIPRFGASPDGLIGENGVLEIKCPTTETHLEWLIAGRSDPQFVPEEYQPQMLAEMACTGREWCDFVSFDPRLPKKMQMFARRFPRDNERIAAMEAEVLTFLEEVIAKIKMLEEA